MIELVSRPSDSAAIHSGQLSRSNAATALLQQGEDVQPNVFFLALSRLCGPPLPPYSSCTPVRSLRLDRRARLSTSQSQRRHRIAVTLGEDFQRKLLLAIHLAPCTHGDRAVRTPAATPHHRSCHRLPHGIAAT